MTEKRCENCAAFHPKDPNGELVGECRLNPPTVFMVAIPRPATGHVVRPGQQGVEVQINFSASFPTMPSDGWCLKFTPRVDPVASVVVHYPPREVNETARA